MKSRARGDFGSSEARRLDGAAHSIPQMRGLRAVVGEKAGCRLRPSVLVLSIHDSGAVFGAQPAGVKSGSTSDLRKESFVGTVEANAERPIRGAGRSSRYSTTPMSVTVRACARPAPATVVADL
jgi:hypothetical protein